MPYKHEKSKIPTKLKKSAKLTQDDKEIIRKRYLEDQDISQYELAREYNVSRRTIVFAIYPDRAKQNYQNRVAKGGSKQYYSKEKNTLAMRRHRRYKQKLYVQNKLIKENDEKT